MRFVIYALYILHECRAYVTKFKCSFYLCFINQTDANLAIDDEDDDGDGGLLVFHDVDYGNQCLSADRKESQVKDEIDRYLRAKPTSDIQEGLKDYPIIQSIFMKFNCIRSSEAVCERMFSFAGKFFFNHYSFCDVHCLSIIYIWVDRHRYL